MFRPRHPPSPCPRPSPAGTDGCSEPVGVLKHDGLAPLNTYVAPGVTTLQQAEDLPAVSSRLYLDDGEVRGRAAHAAHRRA